MSSLCLQPSVVRARQFLVDYRVVISFMLFATLLVAQVYVGTRPRGWWTGGDVQGLLGASLVLVGLIIRSWAAGVLQKGKALAVTGPYSLCKHPLYLGSYAMMLGFSLLLNSPAYLVVAFGPIALIYWVTMLSEERRLTEKYGERWTTYSAAVPRFLPWRWARYIHVPFSVEGWIRNREYKALLTTAIALAVIELWHRS